MRFAGRQALPHASTKKTKQNDKAFKKVKTFSERKETFECQLSRFNDSEFKLLQSFDACEDFDLTKFLK